MIRVDYSKYLKEQKVWAETLTRQANLDGGVTDREAALLAILAMNRLIALSLRPTLTLAAGTRQDLPGGRSETLAA